MEIEELFSLDGNSENKDKTKSVGNKKMKKVCFKYRHYVY
jgi:hypothetical protein